MSKKRPAAVFVLLLILGLLVGCAPAPDGDDGRDEPVRIVATTGMIADTVTRLVGDLADSGQVTVEGLMGPGIDPHLYKASESDVRTLAEADLILYNGLFLEGKMGDILVKLARTRPVVAVSETIPEERRREPPELQGHYDPHIWFDVSLWADTVTPMAEALIELMPDQAVVLYDNAKALQTELATLDAWAQGRIDTIPEERRVLITAHDAFGYFGDRYGLEVIGIQGISTLAEAGLQDVERVVDLVVERRIPAIFIESSVPKRTVEAVIAAAADRGHTVAIGGELFSDAMGAPGTTEGTYDGMVRHNVDTVVEALAGSPADAEEPAP